MSQVMAALWRMQPPGEYRPPPTTVSYKEPQPTRMSVSFFRPELRKHYAGTPRMQCSCIHIMPTYRMVVKQGMGSSAVRLFLLRSERMTSWYLQAAHV
jgi:hypothetical protein